MTGQSGKAVTVFRRLFEGLVVSDIDGIILGQSAQARELRRLVEVVAPSASSVLVQGETGTGKEMVAEAIHAMSGRKGKLVTVNCAAIPAELLESELFGHEKGAFTGADKARQGRFELADNGTLFLDEIGDMPLELQSKLLRALESRKIQRVGGSDDIEVDFRLVCATHQNIESFVDKGSFRADLFYRINVFPILLPAWPSAPWIFPFWWSICWRKRKPPMAGRCRNLTTRR